MELIVGQVVRWGCASTWYLGNKKIVAPVWQSKDFFISEENCTFCFRLTSDGSLYLCHLGDGSLSLNLRVSVKYNHRIHYLNVGRLRITAVIPPYTEYFLGIVDVQYGILGITCEFLSKNEIDDKGSFSSNKKFHDSFLREEDSDITLKIGDLRYPVHKAIIKAQCPVFYEHMIEKSDGNLKLSDWDPQVFHDFLLYLYTGRVDHISMENVFEFFQISDKYHVPEMKDGLVDFIEMNLSVDNFCDVLSFAMNHNEEKLFVSVLYFFGFNAKDIVLSENWQTFFVDNALLANEFFIKMFKEVSHIEFDSDESDLGEYHPLDLP